MQIRERKKLLPLWALIVLDTLALGAALVVFALFHHVLPRSVSAGQQVRPVSATPAPVAVQTAPAASAPPEEPQAEAVAEAAPEPDARSPWAVLFAPHFTEDVVITDSSYSSPSVSVSVSRMELEHGDRRNVCYIADIYIADIRSFRTYLPQDEWGKSMRFGIGELARQSDAIAAMTGDMYAFQGASLVLRNGELYRDGRYQTYQTHCALFYDGTMEVYGPNEIDYQEAMDSGAWQIWSFGPVLVRDGTISQDFSSGMAVEDPNPRAALGYYEPGHYCFVVVDGRRPGYSFGMSFQELAELFLDLGCACAYNLDGGGSAVMMLNGQEVNLPSGGGRDLSDIILIAEPPTESGAAE